MACKLFTLFKFLVTGSRFIVETRKQLMAVQLSFVETGSHMSKNMRFATVLSLALILFWITPLLGKKLEVRSIHFLCSIFVFFMFSAIFNIMQVEFNKAAQSLTEAVVPSAQKKTALSRLVKVVCFALMY